MSSGFSDASPMGEAVAERLAAWLTARPRRILSAADRPAAVLVPLFERDGAWWVLFTRRTETVGSHPGQISFPGGRYEPADLDLGWTALRESHEEVGLAPEHVKILGALDDIATVFGVRITPYLGIIPPGYPFQPQADEVAEVFALPLTFFTSPGCRRVEMRTLPDGREREVYYFDRDPEPPVWGATARIIAMWLDALDEDLNTGRALLEMLVNGAGPLLDGVPDEA